MHVCHERDVKGIISVINSIEIILSNSCQAFSFSFNKSNCDELGKAGYFVNLVTIVERTHTKWYTEISVKEKKM